MFGSKKSTKTTTSESLTNLGTSLTSGGDIQLSAGADILLSGTKATAAGDIGLQAVGGDPALVGGGSNVLSIPRVEKRYL